MSLALAPLFCSVSESQWKHCRAQYQALQQQQQLEQRVNAAAEQHIHTWSQGKAHFEREDVRNFMGQLISGPHAQHYMLPNGVADLDKAHRHACAFFDLDPRAPAVLAREHRQAHMPSRLAARFTTTGIRTAARIWKASAFRWDGSARSNSLGKAENGSRQGVRWHRAVDVRRARSGVPRAKGWSWFGGMGKNRPNTKKAYNLFIDRIVDKWGALPVSSVTAREIYAFRELYGDTPSLANQLVKMLSTLIAFGIPRGYIDRNPAADVKAIPIVDIEHARRWPGDAFKRVIVTAPEYIRRAAFLGRATGQRRSDLVKFGRKHRVADGLQIKVSKLRDKGHFIPLKDSELAEIDSWSCSETGPWITNVFGKPMTGNALGAQLELFLADVPELSGLRLKAHGWRAMAVCDRRLDGLSHQEISAQLCMSLGMVMRYSKHIDQ